MADGTSYRVTHTGSRTEPTYACYEFSSGIRYLNNASLVSLFAFRGNLDIESAVVIHSHGRPGLVNLNALNALLFVSQKWRVQHSRNVPKLAS